MILELHKKTSLPHNLAIYDQKLLLSEVMLFVDWYSPNIAKKTNNYFGMMANNNWPTERSLTVPPSAEELAKNPQAQPRIFRTYPSALEGFKGYIENIRSKNWYDDARRDGERKRMVHAVDRDAQRRLGIVR